MIDIHSHLIPNVDDGSKNVEETLAMIKEANKAGFTDIILTSHFLEESYEPNINELFMWTDKLNEALNEQNINIKLHSGMEIYISDRIEELVNSKKIITLANSKYILIELPLSSQVKYIQNVISFLKSRDIVSVIAHPERYSYVQDNPKLIDEYIKMGALIQCNYVSILGFYGSKAKKTIKTLLKNNKVSFLGSDCHKPNIVYKNIPIAIKKIKRIVGENKFIEISTTNPKKILENKSIASMEE